MSRANQAAVWVRGIAVALYKRSVYAVALLAAVGLLVIIVNTLYCWLMPSTWFLNYQPAQVSSVVEGEDVPMTLCRTRHLGAISAHATRTFYYSTSFTGKYETVFSYTFAVPIEDGDQCIGSVIKTSRYKHKVGYYKFHTDVNFTVKNMLGMGFDKTTPYDSAIYRILDRPSNAETLAKLKAELKALQEQISQLEATTVSRAAINTAPASTAKTNTPTSSAPPERTSAPSTPVQSKPTPPAVPPAQQPPSLIQGVLNSTSNILKGVI